MVIFLKYKAPRRNEGLFSIACHYKRFFIYVICNVKVCKKYYKTKIIYNYLGNLIKYGVNSNK